MPTPHLGQTLRRIWVLDRFGSSAKVLLSFAICLAFCWSQDQFEHLSPLFFGVIACGLTETDDSWKGRLSTVIVTMLCFTGAAYSVEILFNYPWLFAISLALSAFALTMLGALGERFATLGWGTLILSVYSMIGLEMRGGHTDQWFEPLYLLGGAASFGVISVIWQALFAHQPVQIALARLFRELGRYLKLKSAMFKPLRHHNLAQQEIELAQQNARVVSALNAAKDINLNRVGNGRPGPKVNRYLKLYFLAQDIHERASSSHYAYQQLTESFFHSDVLYRCQNALYLHGKACSQLAQAIELHKPFEHNEACAHALQDLQDSLSYLHGQENPAWRRLLRSLGLLTRNLLAMERLFSDARNPDALAEEQDNSLLDREPQSARDVFKRFALHMTPTSLLFRHAVRLSLALAIGYGLMHLLHATQGYWILLTTVFVCQPNYGATQLKSAQRTAGTVMGLALGWVLFEVFPDPHLQALFAVLAGTIFFAARITHYGSATAAVTLLLVFCLNQSGSGYDLFIPRLVDTALGGLIAALAVWLILPDWQVRRFGNLLGNTLTCSSAYLRQIISQYGYAKRDHLQYRLARRNAHNADAALSTTLANIMAEPSASRKNVDIGFRFLVISHTLLNYLSALGAHRDEPMSSEVKEQLTHYADQLAVQMDSLGAALLTGENIEQHSEATEQLAKSLEELSDDSDEGQRLVQSQLALLCRQLIQLRALSQQLQSPPATAVPASS